MYKEITLTQGQISLVDQEDFDQLMKYNWYYCAKTRDARRSTPLQWNKKILMHRDIMQCPPGLVVDHINHDTLDNRRVNLRICTQQQNIMNKPPKKKGPSQYRGVMRHPQLSANNPWWARVWKDGKTISLGYFATELEAAQARDEAAKVIYGEFASLNFPEQRKVVEATYEP